MSTAVWACAAITAVSALISLGFSVQSLIRGVGSARTAAGYAASRSVALAVVALVALFDLRVPFVVAIALAMIVVQALDALVGAMNHDRVKTIGPAITSAANIAALLWVAVSR